jgi:hypothetical protein
LDGWVAELNSDVFVNRESATQRLIGAGRAGIERVEAAVTKGPLEVVIRGVHVLREVALSEEGEAQEAAQAVDMWLNTKFSNDERHIRRIKKIENL